MSKRCNNGGALHWDAPLQPILVTFPHLLGGGDHDRRCPACQAVHQRDTRAMTTRDLDWAGDRGEFSV